MKSKPYKIATPHIPTMFAKAVEGLLAVSPKKANKPQKKEVMQARSPQSPPTA
jgi:hypothetical protein